MFVLWRYIIKEHIGPFVFAICVITLVFILNLVFRELPRILSRGLEFSLILEFFMLNMAWIVALAVPMAVLVAALMAFGRLSGDNEIVAMKANGVSVLRMIFPVLLCAAGLALFLVWFNNSVLPDFNHRARLLASDIARKRPTLSLEAGVLYRDLPNYTLLVQNIVETPDTAYVDSVYIDDNSNPNSSTFITADRGKIYLNRRNGQLSLILFDGVMYKLNLEEMEQYQQLRFPKQVISISVPDMVMERSDSEYRGDREKSAAMMREEVGQNRKEIAAAVARMQAKTEGYFSRYLPDLELDPVGSKGRERPITLPLQLAPLLAENQRLRQELSADNNFIDGLDRKNYQLLVEIHKKYSIPVACLVFVLIGAPLGMMARRGSMTMAAGLSFGFFLLYWASLIGGEELADNQIISPFVAMWLADLLVGAVGLYLLLSAVRESTLFNPAAVRTFFERFRRKSRRGLRASAAEDAY
ncbi:MAG TPA: LptF/LptG family permease [bacterium]|nr:LptF/LptG family permease [bacterium]HQG44101.1 LptF/LptG family permease [bacterium]HQJ65074.1 LptF/LptG family permease [bacterium]